MKIKYAKRFMSMMEMLIAMTLTIGLLSALTYFYSQIELLSSASEVLQRKSFHTRYAESRLIQVFANTIPEYNFKDTNLASAYCFFTTGDLHGFLAQNSPSLVFMYNNKAKADGNDADVCLARLFLDKEGRFCLASWEPPYEWKMGAEPPMAKIEVLMENVTLLEFEFFVAPQREEQLEPLASAINEREHYYQTIEPPISPTCWVKVWEKEYNKLPPMIKIFIRQQEKNSKGKFVDTQFAFPLPLSKDLIVYEG